MIVANGTQPPDGNVPDNLSEEALRQRSLHLGDALKKANRPNQDDVGHAAKDARGLAQALRMISEFVAGAIAGAGIGWVLDYVFGTKPLWLIMFLLLGFVTGFYNVVRAAGVLKK
jgi:ATP synthase protein I